MKIGLSILVAGFFMLASCSSGQKRAEYLTKIDSLSAVLQKDATAFKNIDTTLIALKIRNMDSQLAVLKLIDSLSIIPEKVTYSELKNSFNLFLKESPQLLKEAETCKSQLENLKFDTEKKLITIDEVQVYFKQESESVGKLQNQMELFQKRINSQLKNYALLNPKIEYLLDSLTKN